MNLLSIQEKKENPQKQSWTGFSSTHGSINSGDLK